MLVGKRGGQAGFTLIELLVTLMIAAIMAMMAVPAFSDFLARQQFSSDVNELISVLSFARSEAIKQRSDISVFFSPPNATTSTRRPVSCRNSETTVANDESGEGESSYRYSAGCYWVEHSGTNNETTLVRVGQSANITSPQQAFSLTFKNLGDADISLCPASPCELMLAPTRGNASLSPVTLVIRTTGSIRRKESGS
ncbi:pilus assembly FimT family protein [Halomonas sp. AOP13-D3-9]